MDDLAIASTGPKDRSTLLARKGKRSIYSITLRNRANQEIKKKLSLPVTFFVLAQLKNEAFDKIDDFIKRHIHMLCSNGYILRPKI